MILEGETFCLQRGQSRVLARLSRRQVQQNRWPQGVEVVTPREPSLSRHKEHLSSGLT